MEIPNEVKKSAFNNLIKQGFVFRLRGDIPFESEDYHVFAVLNFDPKTGDVLLLTNGTSQVEKQTNYLRRTHVDVEATTVILEAGSYSFITKPTLFNCNSVHTINIEDISFDNDDAKLIGNQLSQEDVDRLVNAALASDNVLPEYKKLIRPDVSNQKEEPDGNQSNE
ncbi:hypothetical protein IKD67_01785 [Candidatus Saccharibacteria bacterium]|nr:hypothetical protein [Candidatus Saccharibacteria bacterium]